MITYMLWLPILTLRLRSVISQSSSPPVPGTMLLQLNSVHVTERSPDFKFAQLSVR